MTRLLSFAAALALLVALATAAGAQQVFVELSASLSGDNEVSGGSGSGTAIVEIDDFTSVIPSEEGVQSGEGQKLGTVCYSLTLEGVDDPVAAHIHLGDPGVDGDVVVDFDIAVNGLEACVSLESEPLEAIVANPSAYYVNVHTEEFPDGAVRGQLQGDPASTADSNADANDEELASTGSNATLLLVLTGLVLVGAGTLLRQPQRRERA